MLWVLVCCGFGEAILMSTHNIYFDGELMKIILQLSSVTLLICSSVHMCIWRNTTQNLGPFSHEMAYV